jgi:predicted transcriptional regulator
MRLAVVRDVPVRKIVAKNVALAILKLAHAKMRNVNVVASQRLLQSSI